MRSIDRIDGAVSHRYRKQGQKYSCATSFINLEEADPSRVLVTLRHHKAPPPLGEPWTYVTATRPDKLTGACVV
jgi:hypothetical protein